MKNLHRFFAGLILTLALTSTVSAGKMDCPGVTDPPPEEITSETQSATPSDSIITEALLIVIEGAFLLP